MVVVWGVGGGKGWSSGDSICFPPKWINFKSWMRTKYYVSWVLLTVLVLAPCCFFPDTLPTLNLIHNRRHRTMLLSATTKLSLLNTFFCSFLFPWSVNVTLDPQTCLFSKWREFRIILFLKKIVSIKCRVFIKTQHLLECYKFELRMKLEYANTIKNILQYLMIPFLIC